MSIRHSQSYVWSVTDLIGQGATGNVFICRNKNNGKPFAAKVFNAMGQMRSRDVRMREIELLRKLNHDNVVILVAEEFEIATKATVLIMELCETSLYNVLELPENYFGLSEIEFKCVLKDVVRGMRYLRENNVVHRDVKPGNILKTSSPTGSSVYKLTDFGAAKQLRDAEQSFVSIYGTEEYLHPDVYEKAVMKNFSKKKFTAAVDLWSMGVTFYHAATGQLPFRPYGGRQNKETMFEIISQKGPKIISGLQKSNGGRIEYSDDLPEETRISKGLKNLLRPILQELMETSGVGLEKLITFDQLYIQVEDILSKKAIDVFSTNTSTWHKIYVKEEDDLRHLQSLIAFQTGVSAENQQMFLSSEEFKATAYNSVNNLPVIDKDSPVVVVGGEAAQSAQLHQRRIPIVPTMPIGKTRPEDDFDVLKIYASICYVFAFCAEEFYFCLRATQMVSDTMAKILNCMLENVGEQLRKIKKLREVFKQASLSSSNELNHIKKILQIVKVKDTGSQDDAIVRIPSVFEQVNEEQTHQFSMLLENASAALSSSNLAGFRHIPVGNARQWLEEIRVLSSNVNDMYMQISKVKCMGHAILDDLIYSSKKMQMMENLNEIKKKFECIVELRKSSHTNFNTWLTSIKQKFTGLSNIQASLKSADLQLITDYSGDLDKVSVEKSYILEELHNIIENDAFLKVGQKFSSSASLDIMESEVSALEDILQDIVTLVEEGDQKLVSSKEIFQELSICDS